MLASALQWGGRMKNTAFAGLVLVALSACAMEAGTGTGDPGDPIDGKADGANDGIATVTFSEGFAQELSGTIVPGSPLRVLFDSDRLPGCRGDFNGGPAWTITASWLVDDGQPTDMALVEYEDDLFEATIEAVPAGDDIAFYFQVTNRWGCQEFDSDYGNNYHFPIDGTVPAGQTLISFGADGAVQVSGPVVAGATVLVRYEPSRVEECRGTTYGNPAWNVIGYAAADGGEAETFEVTRVEGYDRVPVDAEVLVPHGDTLELWFQFSNRWGCVAYDSNDGQNYEFAIE
jgi:hypothetical protein